MHSLPSHFRMKLFTQDYLNNVTEVFTQAFCRSEPMTKYLNMDETKYFVFAKSVAQQAIDDKLSIIILDNKRVVALALIEDIAHPGEIPEFDPKFHHILHLLDSISAPLLQGRIFPSEHIGHLFITAVDQKYRHQHLSTLVNFAAMDLARTKGFDFFYSELTHYFNEKGTIPHLQYGKQLIGSQIYHNFIDGDEKPFEHLEGGANSYLWGLHDKAMLQFKKNVV